MGNTFTQNFLKCNFVLFNTFYNTKTFLHFKTIKSKLDIELVSSMLEKLNQIWGIEVGGSDWLEAGKAKGRRAKTPTGLEMIKWTPQIRMQFLMQSFMQFLLQCVHSWNRGPMSSRNTRRKYLFKKIRIELKEIFWTRFNREDWKVI